MLDWPAHIRHSRAGSPAPRAATPGPPVHARFPRADALLRRAAVLGQLAHALGWPEPVPSRDAAESSRFQRRVPAMRGVVPPPVRALLRRVGARSLPAAAPSRRAGVR